MDGKFVDIDLYKLGLKKDDVIYIEPMFEIHIPKRPIIPTNFLETLDLHNMKFDGTLDDICKYDKRWNSQ